MTDDRLHMVPQDEESTATRGVHWARWDRLSNLFVGDKGIWIVTIALMLISIIVVFSAVSQEAFRAENSGQNFFGQILKHLILVVCAFGIIVLGSHVPSRYYLRCSTIAFVFSLILLMLVPFIGIEINGGKRWLKIFFLTFQPSELTRLTLINFTASLLRGSDEQHSSLRVFWTIIIATGITCLLIFMENISTAVFLALIVYLMMWVGGAHRKSMRWLTLGGLGAVTLVILVVLLAPKGSVIDIGRTSTGYSRLTGFFEKIGRPINEETYDDIMGNDYQVVAAQKAIANSNVIGKGPGQSELRQFLPQAFSDYVYNVVVEEYGIIGSAGLLILYLVFFFRCGMLAKHSRSMYRTLVLMGVGILVTTQAMMNMAVAANLLPVTGQTLPFISKGGSSYIITAIYFAIVQSIAHDINKKRLYQDAIVSGNAARVVDLEEVPEMEEEIQLTDQLTKQQKEALRQEASDGSTHL
ncbi:FtsW/RodA/SpoVE family cell cycle protein [uncultured Porphyromonas sp.]|uniref:FtsW/RodA/SpoVE family cell cycle protein n=1 Tax=uncultured Porphyromonas sp. TaxID=159274 RepID=UPI002629997F|nr:FtsW/RodA/SpoVE family cell cycle protein [uncultured Porphyromonas sp.]